MQIEIFTLFPDFFTSPLKTSLLGKALEKGVLQVRLHDLRNWARDRHRTVDDVPYGGGPGMILKPEPIVLAFEAVAQPSAKTRRIYFSPKGRTLQQGHLREYLAYDQLLLLCGRYEGIDQRVVDHFIDEEISVGDYILSGGELPTLVFLECLARFLPGYMGKEQSLEDSFAGGRLEHPHYTRPEVFRELGVPKVLLSGDHQKIAQWRETEALELTKRRRPDLLK